VKVSHFRRVNREDIRAEDVVVTRSNGVWGGEGVGVSGIVGVREVNTRASFGLTAPPVDGINGELRHGKFSVRLGTTGDNATSRHAEEEHAAARTEGVWAEGKGGDGARGHGIVGLLMGVDISAKRKVAVLGVVKDLAGEKDAGTEGAMDAILWGEGI